jgi:hypothetical protein
MTNFDKRLMLCLWAEIVMAVLMGAAIVILISFMAGWVIIKLVS